MENLERERRDVGVFRDEIWLCVDVCVERERGNERESERAKSTRSVGAPRTVKKQEIQFALPFFYFYFFGQ